MSETDPTFIRVAGLMKRLDVSRSTLYRLVHTGKLAPPDNGRWTIAEVKRYERACYVEEQKRRKAA